MMKQIKIYKKAKLKLIHMNGRTKEPATRDWPNTKTKYKHWANGGAGDNVGLPHNMNNTICFDIDNVSLVCELYPDIARVIEDKFCGARYASGKPNRMKILFLLPPELIKEFTMITLASGCGQIRGGKSGLQDLLPPSVHPENKAWVYTWEDSFTGVIPFVPAWLTKKLLEVVRTIGAAKKEVGDRGKPPHKYMEIYNEWFMEDGGNLVDSILALGGYELAGFNRLKRIGSDNKQAVVIYNDPDGIDRAYNFSDSVSSDPNIVYLPFGASDPYDVLSTSLGFDEARRYVCSENTELKGRVDDYEKNEGGEEPVILDAGSYEEGSESGSGSGDEEDSGSGSGSGAVDGYVDSEQKFTKYPEQVGAMGSLVEGFMKMHPFITPEIAVVQAHMMVSSLGGRVYTLTSGTGLVWTALVVGRTGRGKSFLLKHVSKAIGDLQYGKLGGEAAMGGKVEKTMEDAGKEKLAGTTGLKAYVPVAASYYTSVKNFVKDIKTNGSILSVRTESGQSDRSKAGDMARVNMLELELSTQSGKAGFVSKGGQNDDVPAMFSPACTVIRETVLESTLASDLEKNVDVAGQTGRRSHVVINPFKPYMNPNIRGKLECGSNMQKKLVKLFGYACRKSSMNVLERMPDDQWITIKFKSSQVESYYASLTKLWTDQENHCVETGDLAGIAFYSRLYEKVPAWSARLAVMDNIDAPVITREMIDCAVASLKSEHEVFKQVKEEVVGPWDKLCTRIIGIIRKANTMKTFTKLKPRENPDKELKAMARSGAVEWTKLRTLIVKAPEYRALSEGDYFFSTLKNKLAERGVRHFNNSKTWKVLGDIFQLVE